MASDHTQGTALDSLRQRIDVLDAELHRLLMERVRVIDGIVAAKRAASRMAAMSADPSRCT